MRLFGRPHVFLHLFVCLFVRMCFVWLFFFVRVRLFGCLVVWLFGCLVVSLFARFSVRQFVYLFVCFLAHTR